MNILQILAHPDFDNDDRQVNQLAAVGLSRLRQKYPEADIATIRLSDPDFDLPRIDKDFLAGADRNIAAQRRLIDQWKGADLIFIYSPLHNFNVPSKLKDYIDNVFIAGETFKYTADGSVGLMSDADVRVALVMTSGSDYRTNFRYTTLDIAPQYMRAILHLMGINEMKLIRAQGLDLAGADRGAILDGARRELTDYIDGL